MERLLLIALIAWVLIILGVIQKRLERRRTPKEQVRVLLGWSFLLPAIAITIAAYILPVSGLVIFLQASDDGQWHNTTWGSLLLIALAIALISAFFVLLYVAMRYIPYLLGLERLVIGEKSLRVVHRWRAKPLYVLYWQEPYSHKVYLHEKRQYTANAGSYTVRTEYHILAQNTQALRICLSATTDILYTHKLQQKPQGYCYRIHHWKDQQRFRAHLRIAPAFTGSQSADRALT